MNNYLIKTLSLFFLLLIQLAQSQAKNCTFTSIKIDTLLKDKISIRAISISENEIYYAADKNRLGYINLNNLEKV